MLEHKDIETVEDCLDHLSIQEEAFPEAARLFKIALTFPVTSASAERFFSVLKRVKSYLRSTMRQERLSNLSILAIEHDLSRSLNYNLVVDSFMHFNLCRIQLK